MAEEKSNEQKQTMSPEQKAVLKKVQTREPGAKLFEARPDGKYYGPVLFADKKNVVQQVGADTFVVHPRQQLGALPIEGESPRSLAKLGGTVVAVNYAGDKAEIQPADPDRWHERQSRTPAAPEHDALAKQALGERFTAFNPPSADFGLSPKYEGVIVATTSDHLIQRLNAKTAIVHNVGADVAKNFAAGQEVAVSYDNGRIKDVATIERPKSQERTAERPGRESASRNLTPDEAAKAKSWAIARNLVNAAYGQNRVQDGQQKNEFFSAKRLDAEKGKYRGPIVAVTDHHVVQRVGVDNKFVVHDRADLQGDLQTGTFVQMQYDKGKARVTPARQNERQQSQSQERAPSAPQRVPADRDRSQGQGMSR